MIKLGVNIDHVATVRQQRLGNEPDPVAAALVAEQAGANSIICHLREDRRHIQDKDLRNLRKRIKTLLNLEMAATHEMERIALEVVPDRVCIVPEKRRELTTEGGLHVAACRRRLQRLIERLHKEGTGVSLFINPAARDIALAREVGADIVELHTGRYADAPDSRRREELHKLHQAAQQAARMGLRVHAGHGLDYRNVGPVAQLPAMEELNIGFSIVSRALFVGMAQAVKEMKGLIGGMIPLTLPSPPKGGEESLLKIPLPPGVGRGEGEGE